MTQSLIILTPFADMSELAENFASRVDESHLMLPYSEAVAEGEWVTFVVQLADESSVLTGQGRCTGSNDNGEEYPPEYRFDVVLDSLAFEGMNEVMFERILVARESQASGDPGTGEIDLDQMTAAVEASQPAYAEASGLEEAYADAGAVDFAEPSEVSLPGAAEAGEEAAADVADAYGDDEEDVPTQFGTALRLDTPVSAAPVEEPASVEEWQDDEGDFDQPTQMGNLDQIAASPSAKRSTPPMRQVAPAAALAAPSSPRPSPRGAPVRAPGTLPLMHSFEEGVLTRPSVDASWVPTVTPRPEAAQSNGLFEYGGKIPRPASPPRPELTEEQRVAAAPSPSAPWSRSPVEADVAV